MEIDSNDNQKVVEINSPQKNFGTVTILASLVIFLAVFATLAFAAGYLIGNSSLKKQPEKQTKTSTTPLAPDGKDVYLDSDEGYQITFPKSWKAEGKSGTTAGVILKKESSSIELWVGLDQPYTLSKDQKGNLKATNKVEVTINGKKLSMTEYSFKDGSFITIATIPATTSAPLVTFLIKADSQENYDEAKEIIQSLTFL